MSLHSRQGCTLTTETPPAQPRPSTGVFSHPQGEGRPRTVAQEKDDPGDAGGQNRSCGASAKPPTPPRVVYIRDSGVGLRLVGSIVSGNSRTSGCCRPGREFVCSPIIAQGRRLPGRKADFQPPLANRQPTGRFHGGSRSPVACVGVEIAQALPGGPEARRCLDRHVDELALHFQVGFDRGAGMASDGRLGSSEWYISHRAAFLESQ